LLKCKDGSFKWFEEKVRKLKDSSGKLIGSFGSLRNMTPEKNAITALKETEKSYKDMLDFSPVGMLLIQGRKIVYANNELVKILNSASVADIVGKNVFRFFGREQVDQLNQDYAILSGRKGKPVDFDYNIYDVKRSRVHITGSAIPIQFQGVPSVQIICRNVALSERSNLIRRSILHILESSDKITELNEFFKKIHSVVKNLMPADNFYIALADKQNELLNFPYIVDKYEDNNPVGIQQKTLTSLVFRSEKRCL